MSAADWTRMQRRMAGTKYLTDAVREVNPPMPRQWPYGEALLIPSSVGGSKIRRTASDYTNHLGSRVEDFVLTSQGSGRNARETALNNNYVTQKVTRICSCRNSLNITLPKTGICSNCAVPQHVRIN